MNDDFDLDARLRAGARAFPAAPTPDSAQLRDVLTTSRRRSRRTQGSVLACATAAVAGGAALALRDPQPTESVEVAGPGTTTSAAPSSEGGWTTALDHLCDPETYQHTPGGADSFAIDVTSTEAGGLLPDDLRVVRNGTTVFSIDPASTPTTVGEGGDLGYTLLVAEPGATVPPAEHVLVIVGPVHEATEVAVGVGPAVTTLVHDDQSFVDGPAVLDPALPGVAVEWAPLAEICEA